MKKKFKVLFPWETEVVLFAVKIIVFYIKTIIT